MECVTAKNECVIVKIMPKIYLICVLLIWWCLSNGQSSLEDLNSHSMYHFSLARETLAPHQTPQHEVNFLGPAFCNVNPLPVNSIWTGGVELCAGAKVAYSEGKKESQSLCCLVGIKFEKKTTALQLGPRKVSVWRKKRFKTLFSKITWGHK